MFFRHSKTCSSIKPIHAKVITDEYVFEDDFIFDHHKFADCGRNRQTRSFESISPMAKWETSDQISECRRAKSDADRSQKERVRPQNHPLY